MREQAKASQFLFNLTEYNRALETGFEAIYHFHFELNEP